MTAREFLAGRAVAAGDCSGRDCAGAAGGLRDAARRQQPRRRPPGCAGACALGPVATSAIVRSPARSPPARCAGRRPSIGSSRAFSGRPLERLDPEVLDILRLTLFQLLHLDRVPASAAVNDAVQLTRKVGKSSASSFVNAILRRASRERDPSAAAERTGRRCAPRSSTTWRRRCRTRGGWWSGGAIAYGFEAAEAWCRFNNTPGAADAARQSPARSHAKRWPRRFGRSASRPRPTRFAPDGLIVRRGNPLPDAACTATVLFVVQDEASQLVAVVAGATAGRAGARRLRGARRQDHRDGGRHGGPRPADCLRRATERVRLLADAVRTSRRASACA